MFKDVILHAKDKQLIFRSDLVSSPITKYLKGKYILLTTYNAGGVLDRVDSYMFTGALAYSFVKTFLPLYGV